MQTDLRPWLTQIADLAAFAREPQHVDWQDGQRPPAFCIDEVRTQHRLVNLRHFSAALNQAGLFRLAETGLPGAIVGMPTGMRLVRRFADIVRDRYEETGLQEFDYPLLGDLNSFGNFNAVFPCNDRVLFVGVRADFDEKSPRGLLVPTGEPAIYSDWRERVKTTADLPIEMYRQTRFLRPWSRRSGGGVFSALEGADTFEFHGCYEPEAARVAGHRLYDMLRALTTELSVPVLWSTRPPWSNHHQVSRATIGGDALLPSGASLQIATLYDQQDIFSSVFGIRYRDAERALHAPFHVAGAVSRRLLFTYLLLNMRSDGSLIAGPRLHPEPVRIMLHRSAFDSVADPDSLRARLHDRGVVSTVTIVKSSKDFAKTLKQNARFPSPLNILLQGRRDSTDALRMVVRRSDDHREVIFNNPPLDRRFADFVADALADLESESTDRIARFQAARLVRAENIDEVRAGLSAREAVVAPLAFNAQAVETIAAWKQGEVLGYVEGDENAACIATGARTDLLGYMSPRA